MVKIATPISHLFKNEDYAKRIINYSDCLECRDYTMNLATVNQEVFHCEFQPVHKFTKINFDYLKQIKDTKQDLKLITFHVASCCDRPYIKNKMFEMGGKEYTAKEMLINARKNFSVIKEIFKKDIKIAIENNNYYPADAYKYVTEPEFISQIVYENNICFLFDIAHAEITAYNKKDDYKKYKHRLPLNRIIQLHISSFKINQDHLAHDTHSYPTQKEFVEVKDLLRNPDIQYLTVEYYKDAAYLIRVLRKVKELI